jgi:hypothetical protein
MPNRPASRLYTDKVRSISSAFKRSPNRCGSADTRNDHILFFALVKTDCAFVEFRSGSAGSRIWFHRFFAVHWRNLYCPSRSSNSFQRYRPANHPRAIPGGRGKPRLPGCVWNPISEKLTKLWHTGRMITIDSQSNRRRITGDSEWTRPPSRAAPIPFLPVDG